MSVSWGKPSTCFLNLCTESPVDTTTEAQPGQTYHGEWSVTGASTLFPGWENDALAQTYGEIMNNGGVPTYIHANSDGYVVAEWEYDEATATKQLPILVWVIVAAVVAILAYLLMDMATDFVTAITPIATPENWMFYGVLGLAGVAVIIYLLNRRQEQEQPIIIVE
jgi:uncharacterized membrane protein YuzA (DUF378 family)